MCYFSGHKYEHIIITKIEYEHIKGFNFMCFIPPMDPIKLNNK